MKKSILFLSAIALSVICSAQTTVLMNNVAATATGNYKGQAYQAEVGSIQISTSAAFNGSTTTAAIQCSNDGTIWSTLYADDNVTPVTFTLTAGENSYICLMKAAGFEFYRIVYTKGNATLGTVKAVMSIK